MVPAYSLLVSSCMYGEGGLQLNLNLSVPVVNARVTVTVVVWIPQLQNNYVHRPRCLSSCVSSLLVTGFPTLQSGRTYLYIPASHMPYL